VYSHKCAWCHYVTFNINTTNNVWI
jgi:hypothetical protein